MNCCYTAKVYDTKWEKDKTIAGVDFEKVKYIVSIADNDTLKIKGILKEAQKIQGYPCAKNYVSLTYDYRLCYFKLNREMNIKHNKLPKGTWVDIRNDSTMLCMFQKDIMIDGKHPCKGAKTENGAKGIHTWFYPNGNLNGYFAYEDVNINGVWCKASLLHPVTLHKNGKLKTCKLAKNLEFEGEIFLKGTEVRFDEEGQVLSSF